MIILLDRLRFYNRLSPWYKNQGISAYFGMDTLCKGWIFINFFKDGTCINRLFIYAESILSTPKSNPSCPMNYRLGYSPILLLSTNYSILILSRYILGTNIYNININWSVPIFSILAIKNCLFGFSQDVQKTRV